MGRQWIGFVFLAVLFGCTAAWGQPLSWMPNLALSPDFQTHRISSNDPSGGNQDWIGVEPGETRILAEIQGPGAITHLWNTVDAEKYYPRMLILRIYWDGQNIPSVEVPLGDFFAVGHGLDRPFQSAAADASSEGRARNAYWFMPFQKSAKVTLSHEGFFRVDKFYFYIDYRTYSSLPDNYLYFHAQYRQAVPNAAVDLKGKNRDGATNYVLLDTTGKGQYVGSVVSVQMNEDGWFGEGDDMFFVDGSDKPSLLGTGTEDYFNDAWGFREFSYPYHGVTLWEGYKKGDRGTAYKWHLFDPVAFQASLKATLEHGHANDRRDDWYSVAFWYQTLPSPDFPALPGVFERLPDEGQWYAKRLFLNKELALRTDRGQWPEAIQRIEEYLQEDGDADAFGYWALRRGLLAKRMGNFDRAREWLAMALEKSDSDTPKGIERDAKWIHEMAEWESPILEKSKTVRFYTACDDSYELFVDGVSVRKGSGWNRIDSFELPLSKGKHLIAVTAKNQGSKAGFLLQISHRDGFELTDSSWKVSLDAPDNWMKNSFNDSQWKDSEIVGRPGVGNWMNYQPHFTFLADFLPASFIWSPDGVKDGQTVYFRKMIQIK